MSAGARYRARQETAAESHRLNASATPAPRSAPRAAPRDTPRSSGGSTGVSEPRRSAGRSVPLAPRSKGQGGAPSYHNYQAIILAEFVAAELLVSATPIAVRKNQPGLSPYVPRDMMKLVAIGMVYFVLELMAAGGGKAGRFGAWFGGLILLTVGLNEAANITKTLDLFAGVENQLANGASTVKSALGKGK